VFIDVLGTRDRLLEVEAVSGKARAVMGQTLPAGPRMSVNVHVVGVQGGSVELVANGVPVDGRKVAVASQDERVTVPLDGRQCGWISANVRSDAGRPWLIGNPVYLDCGKARKAKGGAAS
jgi:hypothetical protein